VPSENNECPQGHYDMPTRLMVDSFVVMFLSSENNECPQGHYDIPHVENRTCSRMRLPLKTTNARKGITTLLLSSLRQGWPLPPSENNECPQGHYDNSLVGMSQICPSGSL